MKVALLLGMAVCISAPNLKDSPKKDGVIIGEWISVSLTMDGLTTKALGRSYELTAGGLWITRREGVAVTTYPDAYELDSKADPPTIDIGPLVLLGNGIPSQRLGIYKLEGDTLTICFAVGAKERPKNFESPEGSRVLLMVLKRATKKD